MLEKFTEKEIEQIRRELAEYDAENADREKPANYYKDRINKMFKDRPYHYQGWASNPDIAIYVSRAIDQLVSLTMDCTKITDKTQEEFFRGEKIMDHSMHTRKLTKVPRDVANEYYSMFKEILDVMEKHLKPYERFVEEAGK